MASSESLVTSLLAARDLAMTDLAAALTQLATLESDLYSRLHTAPQPNYTISGPLGQQSFSHGDLLKTLQNGIDTWMKKIAGLQKLIEDQTAFIQKLQPFSLVSKIC